MADLTPGPSPTGEGSAEAVAEQRQTLPSATPPALRPLAPWERG
jgi:hypothetical protein